MIPHLHISFIPHMNSILKMILEIKNGLKFMRMRQEKCFF